MLKMLPNRGNSSDFTPWNGISKKVRVRTLNRINVANKFTYLERNRKVLKVQYIILKIKIWVSILFPNIIRNFP